MVSIKNDEIDIDTTVRMHSGDCRVWYKTGLYDVLDAKQIIMNCKNDSYYENIFDWLEENIPTLFIKHQNIK